MTFILQYDIENSIPSAGLKLLPVTCCGCECRLAIDPVSCDLSMLELSYLDIEQARLPHMFESAWPSETYPDGYNPVDAQATQGH